MKNAQGKLCTLGRAYGVNDVSWYADIDPCKEAGVL